MKVLPFKIPKPKKEALVYQEDYELVFYDKLHQHEEIQISLIVEGTGSLIVGDTISTYRKDDILLIGGNIPHVFRSDSKKKVSVMYTLFFTANSFGKDFFKVTDLEDARIFFEKAEHGLKIFGNAELISIFKSLQHQTKIERIGSLLRIINLIMLTEGQSLSSFIYRKKITDNEGKRMSRVFEYAMENFKDPISLEEVAQKANMSRNAFCRYFKRRTNKTFFQFLTELRIERACKLLVEDKDIPVSAVCELSGFQNIANFNRQFKKLKNQTPSSFRTHS